MAYRRRNASFRINLVCLLCAEPLPSQSWCARVLTVCLLSGDRGYAFFPVLPVEGGNRQKFVAIIKASCVHIVAVRVRAGSAEGVHATNSAEAMFSGFSIEAIRNQVLLALFQAKILGLSNQIDHPFFATNRAVAGDRMWLGNTHRKAYEATVTTTLIPVVFTHCRLRMY